MRQIYTGDGKGKTTAAVGLSIRAYGAGKRVAFFQFMKALKSHEVDVMERLGIYVDREWDGKFIRKSPTPLQIKMVKNQYKRAREAVKNGYDLVVLDEIIVAAYFKVLMEDEILFIMEEAKCELVLTGRGATQKMIERAELVTYMKKIKHYFDEGVKAREGFEF